MADRLQLPRSIASAMLAQLELPLGTLLLLQDGGRFTAAPGATTPPFPPLSPLALRKHHRDIGVPHWSLKVALLQAGRTMPPPCSQRHRRSSSTMP